MRLPRLVRTTPFRLTLLFLALFAAAASAFLGYIYIATVGEAARTADAAISREALSLESVYEHGGFSALNEACYRGPVCIEVEDRAFEGSLEDRKRALRQSKRPRCIWVWLCC